MPKKKSPKSDKPATSEVSKVVSDVLKDFTASWDYAKSSWHDRWQNNNFLYNNQRVKRGYDGITDTFVPMCFSTVETLVSGLFGANPKVNYLPPKEKKDQKTDILNALYEFYRDKDQWSLKNINTGRGMIKLGTSIDYYMWVNDHPVKINIPVRDFFIDPTATSLENARFMGRRYLTTKDDLKSFEVVDFEKSSDDKVVMKKKYKNLNRLDAYKTLEKTDKEEKDMWYGSTLADPPEDQVEVIEYWTEDKTISIANRSVAIEDSENYFKAKARANGIEFPKGIMPFNDARDYVDESLFYAKGEIDFISDQQELLNDITNQNIDSVTYTLNQMYTLDPKYASLINEIENLPGAVYPVEANALQPIQQRPIPPDAFAERQNIKNEMRETTASNEIVKGAPAEGGKTTATEINAQIAGAGQRISLKVTQLENGYFHREARIVFEMVKLYVTEPMMVRIVGKDGARWEEFDPKEFAEGDYEPRVQLDITIQNKKMEEADRALGLLKAFGGDPDVNQIELKKLALARGFELDPDEVELLMQPNPPAPVDGMGMPGAMPPPAPPMPLDPMSQNMPPEMMGALPPEMAPMPPLEPILDPTTGLMVDPITGEPIPMPEEMLV